MNSSQPRDSRIFLDTSVHIARFVHGPKTKAQIRNRLQQHEVVVSGSVVRAEFIRRLLKEADYLWRLLQEHGSYRTVLRHVLDGLPPQQARKRNICLQTLTTVDEQDGDEDRTDRLRLYLRRLLRRGVSLFDESVDVLVESGCAAGEAAPIQKGKRFEFPAGRCLRHSNCTIGKFLKDRKETCRRILSHLGDTPESELTSELKRAALLCETVLKEGNEFAPSVHSSDPCLTCGDAVIAIESRQCTVLFSMNIRESRVLAKALDQTLVYLPPNPERDEEIIPPT